MRTNRSTIPFSTRKWEGGGLFKLDYRLNILTESTNTKQYGVMMHISFGNIILNRLMS